MATTLLVTNDFPPRIGGIESFVEDICALLDGDVVVYTSGPAWATETDRGRAYRVVRDGALLLPTARTADRARSLLRESGATRVIFGAAAPLGLLAPTLRAAGAERILALSHGHEVGWASLPGTRAVLRRIASSCDGLGYISDYTRARLEAAIGPALARRLVRLPPPIAVQPVAAHDPAPDPRCIAVSRFVPQKGVATLLRAWAQVVAAGSIPANATLVLVGDGPERERLELLAYRLGLATQVRFTGPLPRAAVAAELRAARVFALPMRTRLGGLYAEGLGLAALEAAAAGLPVLVGNSGGSAETVRHGETGYVVHPSDAAALARRLTGLLASPETATRMGVRGRAWVAERFGVEAVRARLAAVLGLGALGLAAKQGQRAV